MKLTIKQLKQLIKEQVEEGWADTDNSLGSAGGGDPKYETQYIEMAIKGAIKDAVYSDIEKRLGSAPSARFNTYEDYADIVKRAADFVVERLRQGKL